MIRSPPPAFNRVKEEIEHLLEIFAKWKVERLKGHDRQKYWTLISFFWFVILRFAGSLMIREVGEWLPLKGFSEAACLIRACHMQQHRSIIKIKMMMRRPDQFINKGTSVGFSSPLFTQPTTCLCLVTTALLSVCVLSLDSSLLLLFIFHPRKAQKWNERWKRSLK